MKKQIWQLSDYIGLLKSNKENVRYWALRRCIDLFGLDAKTEIASLINDPDESIAIMAISFIGDKKLKEYSLPILKRFRDSSGNLASVAAIALGKLGYKEAFPYLKEELKGNNCDFNKYFGIALALGELKTDEALKILMEIADEIAFDNTPPYIISAIYVAILSHNEPDASKKVIHEALSGLMLIRDTGEKEKILTSLIKHLINPDILETIQHLYEQGEKDLGELIYEATELEALDPNETVITSAFKNALKSSLPSKFVRAINSSLSFESLDSMIDGDTHDFRQGALLLLKAFEEAAIIISKQPKKIKKLIIFAAMSAYLSVLEQDNFSISDDGKELLWLFEREVKFPLDFEEELIDRIAAMEDDMTDFCAATIENDPYSLSALRAVILLGRSGRESAIPVLVRYLDDDAPYFLFDTALKALRDMKNEGMLSYLEPFFKNNKSSGIIGSLGVLECYPTEETVDLLLEHFEDLWINYNEPLLGTIEDIASSRFIEPLKKELKEGEYLAESAYLLLCDLNNVQDPALEKIRERIEEYEEKQKKRSEYLDNIATESDLQALIDETISIELKCSRCERTYQYDVDTVYLYPENDLEEPARIGSRIECKNCGAIDEYELTPMANFALTAEMIKLMDFSKRGGDPTQYKGPLKTAPEPLIKPKVVSNTVKKRKIGRNEPCPCNSGKKYKKCCGR